MKDDRPAEWIAQRMDFVERPKELPIALLCFPPPPAELWSRSNRAERGEIFPALKRLSSIAALGAMIKAIVDGLSGSHLCETHAGVPLIEACKRSR
ncbi:hypothetical protein RX327_31305 [Bradyrhizobium sp. BEA-2-5]|uniref:hypothetical protein n=1 Tax=Bradyrhizobium sp. BEA-2-5 TaxID=3080015 RepID=UPI00293EAD58|nr:hypothetical protein [Bradyrhizobium sp. BEA-2-5]WOH80265.1 hypothetical protein RX327_31305 [Bradyrhizobium sp. BEA-2-5]